jgi:hypothetical protein
MYYHNVSYAKKVCSTIFLSVLYIKIVLYIDRFICVMFFSHTTITTCELVDPLITVLLPFYQYINMINKYVDIYFNVHEVFLE